MRKSKLTRKQKEHIAAYLFILPSFLGIAVFYVVPYIICFIKSLYVGGTFVGIENYIHLFQNNTFLLALKNTSIFTVVAIPLLMVISFLIALFLNSFKKISSFFRSALLIPVVVPVASLICVWQVVFDDYGFHSCTGVTKLVEEYRSHADRQIIHNLNGHAIMIKLK